jgi:hypothetical protein
MRPSAAFTAALITFIAVIACAGDNSVSGYQKGTLAKHFSSAHKSYDLKDGDKGYQISNCGDFQDGQTVDYRVKEDKVYIRRDDGKEFKCSIEAELTGSPDASSAPAAPLYQKGTIEGFEVRYLTSEGSLTGVRKVKAYELRGPDALYEVAFCGSFEAGQFTAGQVVEYHAGGDRLNILHDNDKVWSCQIVSKVKLEDAKPSGEAAQPATASAASTAKLSITSEPDGADIEIDGNFSGNTPSDLEVPEGEHTIVVKKSGYKDWERKMKVAAGSSIHLNADLEKPTNP